MSRIILIGCGKTKLTTTARAKDLYCGQLFKARRAYAESTGLRWYILSGLHGVLSPECFVHPYDYELTEFASHSWGARVVRRLLDNTWSDERNFEIHAGATYANAIAQQSAPPYNKDVAVILPLKGLGIGQQLAWYKHHAERFSRL